MEKTIKLNEAINEVENQHKSCEFTQDALNCYRPFVKVGLMATAYIGLRTLLGDFPESMELVENLGPIQAYQQYGIQGIMSVIDSASTAISVLCAGGIGTTYGLVKLDERSAKKDIKKSVNKLQKIIQESK